MRTVHERADDRRLRGEAERVLARAWNAPVKIASLRREPSLFVSLFPAEVLSLVLGDGRELRLFVKHLGDEQRDHPDKQERDREIRVYEQLLGDSALPAAGYFGWERDERTGRRDVFLEYLPDWDLRYQPLDHWYAAAARLAQLHAYFAARPAQLASCDVLLRLDAAYLYAWAERAAAVVAGFSDALAGAFAGIVRRYEPVAGLIAAQPRTLVHNDLAPKNVLVDRTREPARIAFVDWEMAGTGCGVLDLVDLAYGLEPASDARMREAYCDALAGAALLPDDPTGRERLFAACALHRTVYRLAHAPAWGVPAGTVREWIAEGTALLSRAEAA